MKRLLLIAMLLACVGMSAQVALPYYEGFENAQTGNIHQDGLPFAQYTNPTNAFQVWNFSPRTGTKCLRGNNGYLYFPGFQNAALSDLTIDLFLFNASQTFTEEAYVQIGYLTDNNVFHVVKTYPYLSSYGFVRVSFEGAPSGRIAIHAVSHQHEWDQYNYSWYFDDIRVFATPTSVSLPYSIDMESTLTGAIPDGCWYLSNNNSPVCHFVVGEGDAYSGSKCLKVSALECLVLPSCNTELSEVMLDLFLKDNNGTPSHLEVGYVTDVNDLSTFVQKKRIENRNFYQFARVGFEGAPQGARIAIRKTDNRGVQFIDDLRILAKPSTVTLSNSYFWGFESNQLGTLPDNLCYKFTNPNQTYAATWTVSNQHPRTGSRCLRASQGLLVFPPFNKDIQDLSIELNYYPNNTSGLINIGYTTPDEASTFVYVASAFAYSGDDYHNLRANFANVPQGSRIAIEVSTTGLYYEKFWYLDDIVVFESKTMALPYTQGFENASEGLPPIGWMGENAYVTTEDAYTGTKSLVLDGNSALHLPKVVRNYANQSTFQLDMFVKPVKGTGTLGDLTIGYVTDPNNFNGIYGFHSLYSFPYSSNWTDYQRRSLVLSIPEGAYLSIGSSSGDGSKWFIDDLHVYQPQPKNLPFLEGFENVAVNDLPDGWGGVSARVTSTGSSYSGAKKVTIDNMGYLVLPKINTASFNKVNLDFWLKPTSTSGTSQIQVGYITDPNNKTTFQFLQAFNGSSSWTNYQKKTIDLSSVPADARLAFKLTTNPAWLIDYIKVYQAENIPYEQPFATNNLPEGWSNCVGRLNWNSSSETGTATLSSALSLWLFGAQNGVFDSDSHAYTLMGGNSMIFSWLISPAIAIPDQDDVFVTFDIALSRSTGNQVPLTPGVQEHESFGVYITYNDGATWHKLVKWGGGEARSLEDLNPLRLTFPIDLTDDVFNNYRDKVVRIGFYAECTNASDAQNHVHIDNFTVQHYDFTLPASSVTVSEVAGHSAKVSWTPANPAQWYWDVWVTNTNQAPFTGINEAYMSQHGYYHYFEGFADFSQVATGLAPDTYYKAWVRFRQGSVTSDWVASETFSTLNMCVPPTNLQVEVTAHTALFTWDPGDSNQTSWETWWDGDDNGTVEVTEPRRLITGIDYDPDYDYEFSVWGYCEEEGYEPSQSSGISMDFNVLPPPTLTVNDGTATEEEIPISGNSCGAKKSRCQFIIPAEQLTDMQYSDIKSLTFDNQQYTNGRPWGDDAEFSIYLKEVNQEDFSSTNAFCDWSEMEIFYSGMLPALSGHLLTIEAGYGHSFHYNGGNLLVGFYQSEASYAGGSNFGHADWLGVNNYNSNPNYKPSIYYNSSTNQPFACTFLPKVTFTYETDDYLPPTDLHAYPTSPMDVTITWTPRDGQTGTQIQLYREGYQQTFTWYGNTFNITNLDSDTDYQVRIRARYTVDGEYHYSVWTSSVSFHTPEDCLTPDNLQVSEVGPFSAHLSWDSDAEYDEVEYRDANHMNVEFENGFETGSLPEGWNATTTQLNPSQNTVWAVVTDAHGSSTYSIKSQMSQNTGSTVYNNRISFPVASKKGVLTFWARKSTDKGTFHVQVSDDNSTFTDVQQVSNNELTDTYKKFTIDLSGQDEGAGYIAFVHNSSRFTTTVFVDDVVFETYDDWTSLGIIEGGQYDLVDLTPGTTYQVRVKAHCDTGFNSDWTAPVSFTTVNNIVFQDPLVKAACVYAWDANGNGNGDGELSYAEAAVVTSLETVFNSAPTITSFNELQYFTGLTSITSNAFVGCSSLSSVTLPNTITSIDQSAFGINGQAVGCTSLTSIVFPTSLTTIGFEAFYQSGLTEVNLPYSVTTIGPLAFGDCNSLETISLPATVTDISGNAFTGTSIATIEVDAGNPVYDSRNGCNAIIETATNKLITGCKNTIVPNGITSIGISAFENCSGLTSITLPASLTSIGEYAFLNCHGLTVINSLAVTPPSIESNSFMNLTPGNIKVFVPCGSLADYQDSDWGGFDLVEDCNIEFVDPYVEALCVANWDTNGDGGLSYTEAAAVTDLGEVFRHNYYIRDFNELQYFIGLTEIGAFAFSGSAWFRSVTLPSTVTTIGRQAFYNTFLTQVTLPASVQSIDFLAYGDCHALVSVTLPASVTYLNGNPFSYSYNLTSITVDANNPVYDSRDNCNAIIKKATNTLVTGCQSTVIPNTVTTLGDYSFSGQIEITSITLPASVTQLNTGVFENATGLTEIHVEATTPPMMEYEVFYGLDLDDIRVVVPCGTLEAYRNDYEWGQFQNLFDPCANIVFADATVKALCVANWDTNGDGELSYGEAAAVTSIGTTFKKMAITSFEELQYFTGLTELDALAFNQCGQLTSIILPNTITSIGHDAFTACNVLSSINIPSSVTTIGYTAFSSCRALTSITLPASVTSIGYGPFKGCTALESITVEADNPIFTDGDGNAIIKTSGISVSLIAGCKNTVIPNNVINIDDYAFSDINTLTSIAIPNSVVTIQQRAFSNCTGLTDVVIGAGIRNIYDYAFQACTGLQSLTVWAATPPYLSSNLNPFQNVSTAIPVYVPCGTVEAYQAANGWSSFTNIQASPEFICFADANVKAICVAHWDTNGDGELSYAEAAAVTNLGDVFKENPTITSFDELQYFTSLGDIATNAFYGCIALSSIILPTNVTSINSMAFQGCIALQSIAIPDATTEIMLHAFMNCTSLTQVNFGNGLTTIGDNAFKNCAALTSLTLPASLTTIGNATFEGCTGLTEMTVMAVTPPTLDYWAFNQVPTGIPVYVPCASMEAYHAASGWSAFTNFQGLDCGEGYWLDAGWNCWVPNLQVTAIELMDALDASNITGDLLVNSQDEGFARRTNGTWSSTLTNIVPGEMYKILTVSSGEFQLSGTKPTTITVTIEPGYNWFGFRGSSGTPVTTVFNSNFAPATGDKIIQMLNVEGEIVTYTYTYDGTYWSCTTQGGTTVLQNLDPGRGYIYYNSATLTKTITF